MWVVSQSLGFERSQHSGLPAPHFDFNGTEQAGSLRLF